MPDARPRAAVPDADRRAGMPDSDRRVRRTRRLLGEALVDLIVEQGYECTTVQDVLDRADVGRSTFYAHFRDKDALLMAGFEDMAGELRRDLAAMTPGVPPTGSPAAALFAHAHRNRQVYTALCGRQGGAFVQRHLHRLVAELLREHLRPHLAASRTDLPVEVVVEFATSAAIGLLLWWVDNDFSYTPARMAQLYQRLAAPGVLAALRH